MIEKAGSEDTPVALVDADAQVESFRQTRSNRRSELAEDYVELIADLIDHDGEARQVDIAQRLGVAQPTVAKMLKRLAADGLIQQRRYRGVFLTPAGKSLAERSRERHQIVESLSVRAGDKPGDRPYRFGRHRASCECRDAGGVQAVFAQALIVHFGNRACGEAPNCGLSGLPLEMDGLSRIIGAERSAATKATNRRSGRTICRLATGS